MGYEVKLYVGRVSPNMTRDEQRRWFNTWAMVDVCKPGYDSETYKLSANHDIGQPIYIYGADGNTEIAEDCYGKQLKAFPLDDALAALETDNGSTRYRRFQIAVDLLRSVKANAGDESLSVFLYGY
jgi:hypothetical protein